MPGRPQRSNTQLPIYDSIAQCSAATGIPAAILKRAKRAGCQAFVSTRVHLDKLLPFLFSESDAGVDWRVEHAKWQAMIRKQEHDRRAGLLVEVDGVKAALTALNAKLVTTLRQRLENEAPARMAGLGAPDARVVAKAIVDEVCGEMERFCNEWKA